jgi:hypothetical protein
MSHDHDPYLLHPRSHHHHPHHDGIDRLTRLDMSVSSIEQTLRHQEMMLRDHGAAKTALDERVRKMGSRIGKAEDGLTTLKEQQMATAAKVDKLAELPSRLDAEKARMETIITLAKYAGGGLLLIAASFGRIPWEHAVKLLGK